MVDPGLRLPAHVDAVRGAVNDGIEGVVLTHSHADHAEAAELFGVPVVLPVDGEDVGPFRAIGTPGHSADSVCLLFGDVCFTGDTVLGTGSVFIAPGEGSLSAYLDSLRRLRELDLSVICPGHGPYVWDPAAKLDEYISHRLDRERRLVEALDVRLAQPRRAPRRRVVRRRPGAPPGRGPDTRSAPGKAQRRGPAPRRRRLARPCPSAGRGETPLHLTLA